MKPTPQRQALELIHRAGGIDGAHHKQWMLDQVVRILTETPEAYALWVHDYRGEDDGQGHYEYDWDVGIAP